MSEEKERVDLTEEEKQEQYRLSYTQKVQGIKDMYDYRREWLRTYVAQIEATSGQVGDQSAHAGGSSSYVASGMDWEQLRDMPIKGSSGLTAQQLDEWIASKVNGRDSIMIGMGSAFLEAERLSGNRADAILAHAAVESGWGTSSIVKDKFNWFGIGAFDSSPYESAHGFSGAAAGIINGAIWIADNYTNSSYKQDTYRKMRWNNGVHQYATDTQWDITICQIWAQSPEPIGGIAVVGNQDIDGYMKINGGRVTPPSGSRGTYNSTLATLTHQKGILSLQSLPSDKFIEALDGCTMAVAHEFYPGILLIHEAMRQSGLLTDGKMYVNSAYRRIKPGTSSLDMGAHGWGGAIDIGARGKENALKIADLCWSIGFRAVAVGGNVGGNAGFVHVDAGPPGSWGYGSGVYKGPGTMS